MRNIQSEMPRIGILFRFFVVSLQKHDILIMDEEIKKMLAKDTDGLLTYEYMANHINDIDGMIDGLVDNMINVDSTGQFVVSASRYLFLIDGEKYREAINRLIASAIEKDREHRYIGDLLPAIWGSDYAEHVDELNAKDDNFRRIYKRMFPVGM